MQLTEGYEVIVHLLVTKKLRHRLPITIVQSHVNLLPMGAEKSKSTVLTAFVIALLAVALDAHRLIVPIRVATLLALGDDMVTVHQNKATITVSEQINVETATLVLPSDEAIAFTTTTNALAAVDRKGAEIRDVESALANLDGALAVATIQTDLETLLQGKFCDDLHTTEDDGFFINVNLDLLRQPDLLRNQSR